MSTNESRFKQQLAEREATIADFQAKIALEEPVGEVIEDTSILRPVYETGKLVHPNYIPSKSQLYLEFRGDALAIGAKLYTSPPITPEREKELLAEIAKINADGIVVDAAWKRQVERLTNIIAKLTERIDEDE